ncbi:unnamed protein product, partial [Amoebophrya sp. A120]|eukprot:GSA120T00012149001.1
MKQTNGDTELLMNILPDEIDGVKLEWFHGAAANKTDKEATAGGDDDVKNAQNSDEETLDLSSLEKR